MGGLLRCTLSELWCPLVLCSLKTPLLAELTQVAIKIWVVFSWLEKVIKLVNEHPGHLTYSRKL